MRSAIDKMIRRYGAPMKLVCDGQETAIRAFLQETMSRSEGGSEWEAMPLGQIPGGVFVYIGPVTPEAKPGDALLYREKAYQLRRAQLVSVGDDPMYCWGICVERGDDGTWGS